MLHYSTGLLISKKIHDRIVEKGACNPNWNPLRALPTQTLGWSPESLNTLPPRQIADVASNLMMREG
jgi:hypothetical protein